MYTRSKRLVERGLPDNFSSDPPHFNMNISAMIGKKYSFNKSLILFFILYGLFQTLSRKKVRSPFYSLCPFCPFHLTSEKKFMYGESPSFFKSDQKKAYCI
jgi:hypothetical protein